MMPNADREESIPILQRAGTHEVLGRSRPSHRVGRGRWCTHVLQCWRAVVALGSWAA